MKQIDWQLISRYLRGESTEEESLLLQSWIEASEENQEEWQKILQSWQTSAHLYDNYIPDRKKAWQKIDSRLETDSAQQKSIRLMSFRYWKVAAAVTVLLVSALLISKYNFHQSKSAYQAMLKQTNTSRESMVADLPDGSKVWLNTNTTLYYPQAFDEQQRVVKLEGEAFFDVVRNPEQPFLIEAGSTITQVLGTSFNIDARPNKELVEVTVVSGKVALYNEVDTLHKVVLQKGEVGRYISTSKQLSKQENTDPNFLAWKTGKFIFNETPLPEVCRTLSEFYDTLLVPGSTKEMQLTASFEQQPLQEVLEVISLTLDVQYTHKGDSIILINH